MDALTLAQQLVDVVKQSELDRFPDRVDCAFAIAKQLLTDAMASADYARGDLEPRVKPLNAA